MRVGLEKNLRNLMLSSRFMLCDYDMTQKFCEDGLSTLNRSNVIEMMKKHYLVRDNNEIRDTSIQIFNKVLLATYSEDRANLNDHYHLQYIAAASITISQKLYCSKQIDLRVYFQQLDFKCLMEYERMILELFNFDIPQCTPTVFVEFINSLGPIDYVNKKTLLFSVNALISEFYEKAESMLYAPSTIAISALLISFSMIHVNCVKWLDSIPDFCLPNNNSSIFPQVSAQAVFLDIDSCILAFEKIPSLMVHKKAQSPTSVTALVDEDES